MPCYCNEINVCNQDKSKLSAVLGTLKNMPIYDNAMQSKLTTMMNRTGSTFVSVDTSALESAIDSVNDQNANRISSISYTCSAQLQRIEAMLGYYRREDTRYHEAKRVEQEKAKNLNR